MDTVELARDYEDRGLPVPPKELLWDEAIAETRKRLEAVIICEISGHLWTETADAENGCSELICRRCGATEHLHW